MVISESMINSNSSSSYQKTTAQTIKLVGGNISSGTPLLKQNQTSVSASVQLLNLRRENFDSTIFTETKNSQENLQGVFQSKDQDETVQEQLSRRAGTNSASEVSENNPFDVHELKETLIRRMMEALTGKRFNVQSVHSMMRQQSNSVSKMNIGFALGSTANRSIPTGLSTVTLSMQSLEVESQSTSYSAKGIVKTADGKTIDLDINMSMSSETAKYLETNLGVSFAQSTNKIDPLIINYGGTAASLTDEKFDFDLDADGILDNISFAGAGSGFLALDKNGDGIINDGNELFGPQTNNGFEELRKYDSDNNGWIDEADDIYSQLKVWAKDKDGNDMLFTLKEIDIGAIYLTDSRTDYTMYDSQGNAQAQMSSTSFFLKDSGGAGFISHFDILA